MRVKRPYKALFSLVLCGLSACQPPQGITQFQPVPTEGWSRSDASSFEMISYAGSDSIPEANVSYALSVQARITNRYAFSDLWLVVEQTYLKADTTQQKRRQANEQPFAERKEEPVFKPYQTTCDTVQIKLTDEHNLFSGQGNNLLEYKQYVRHVRLQTGEKAQFRVYHLMKDEPLKGVHDVGIDFVPSH